MAKNPQDQVPGAIRYISAAGAAAPIVRRILQQRDTRDDVRQIVRSARDLYEHLDDDAAQKVRHLWSKVDVHENVDKAARTVHSVADDLGAPRHRGRWGRRAAVVTALGGGIYLVAGKRGRSLRDAAMKPFHHDEMAA
jgi:hypothetical protein